MWGTDYDGGRDGYRVAPSVNSGPAIQHFFRGLDYIC